MMKNLILADNQDITCIGIQSFLCNSFDITSIFRVYDKKELVKSLMLTPNVIVILDYSLFDFRSINDLMNLGSRFENSHWIIFSDELNTDSIKQLLLNP